MGVLPAVADITQSFHTHCTIFHLIHCDNLIVVLKLRRYPRHLPPRLDRQVVGPPTKVPPSRWKNTEKSVRTLCSRWSSLSDRQITGQGAHLRTPPRDDGCKAFSWNLHGSLERDILMGIGQLTDCRQSSSRMQAKVVSSYLRVHWN